MKNSLLFILVTLILPLQACATNYSAEPIQAQVVDSETKQPLAGVNVVANWQLEGGLEGGTNLGQMMVMETVTDSAGHFRFPAWGPKAMPSGYPLEYQNARLKNMDPQLLLFKSGYSYLALYNHKTAKQMGGKEPYVRTSDWNGKTIELREFKGNLEDYAAEFSFLENRLDDVAILDYAELPQYECKWKEIPLMIIAVDREGARLKASKVRYQFSTVYEQLLSSEKYYSEKGCGSVKEFFRKYEK
jgi:hypothetical protein